MADYIRREDAIKYAEHAYHEWNLAMAAADGKREINLVYKRQELCKAVESVFRDMPAADVAPVRHGHWIGEGDGYADGELVFDVWHCSECDYCIDDGTDDPERLPKYCPGCGALMDGGNGNG